MQQSPVIDKVKSLLNFVQLTKDVGYKKVAFYALVLCVFFGNSYGRRGDFYSCNIKSYTGKLNSVIAGAAPQIDTFAWFDFSALD